MKREPKPPSLQSFFSHLSSTFCISKAVQEHREWGLHFISATPISSYSSIALGWECCHERQSFTNLSSVSASCRLHLLKNYSTTGPFHGYSLQAGSSPLHGPELLPGHSFWTSFLWASAFFRTCPPAVCSMGNTGFFLDICCHAVFMGHGATTCFPMTFPLGCKGVPAPGALPPSPPSLTLVSARLLLSHVLIPLSPLLLWNIFYTFLNI